MKRGLEVMEDLQGNPAKGWLMAGRIQGCDLDVVPALMGRLGSPCGTPDTSAIVISTKRSAWRDL